MFKQLKHLIRLRQEWRDNRHFHQGYDWAAGRLLRGMSVDYVLKQVEDARESNRHGDFDKGIEAAVHDWRKAAR